MEDLEQFDEIKSKMLRISNFQTLCRTLEEKSIEFDRDIEDFCCKFEHVGDDLTMNIRCFIPDIPFLYIGSKMPFRLSKDRAEEWEIATSIINDNILLGKFYYDGDESIIYEIENIYDDDVLSSETIMNMIGACISAVDRYNDKLFLLSADKIGIKDLIDDGDTL